MKIAIMGAGAFGTALGGILADNGYDIDYYDSKIEREKLSDVLSNTKVVLITVPSSAIAYLLPHLPKNKPTIIATKGILNDKMFQGFKDYMVVSGPGFAEDIKAGKATKLTATDQRISEWFKADFLDFDMTSDKKGVLMCGALKNVYAMLAGFLNLKKDTKTWNQYILDVADEMREILKINGANPKTVDLVCGVGDLKLTSAMPSRNFEFGRQLAHDHDAIPNKTVEGFTAIRKIKRGEIIVPGMAKNLFKIMSEVI